jgi:hypothetical protein
MEEIAMAGHTQEKNIRNSNFDRETGADYYLGFSEEGPGNREESNAPYKLEPSATEIENFLTRLRQEGL